MTFRRSDLQIATPSSRGWRKPSVAISFFRPLRAFVPRGHIGIWRCLLQGRGVRPTWRGRPRPRTQQVAAGR